MTGMGDKAIDQPLGLDNASWISAMTAGWLAGIVMGHVLHFGLGMMPTIGSLYGVGTVVAGWLAHLFHSTIFAFVFAGLVSLSPFRGFAGSYRGGLILGGGYGVALWAGGAAILMPIWLRSAGMAVSSPPHLAVGTLLAHLLYGAVLGAAYPGVLTQLRTAEEGTGQSTTGQA